MITLITFASRARRGDNIGPHRTDMTTYPPADVSNIAPLIRCVLPGAAV